MFPVRASLGSSGQACAGLSCQVGSAQGRCAGWVQAYRKMSVNACAISDCGGRNRLSLKSRRVGPGGTVQALPEVFWVPQLLLGITSYEDQTLQCLRHIVS
jgi:hypothetical protein